MVQIMENEKQAPSASTAEEQQKKSKRPPNPGVLKVESVMTKSHLMELKHDIESAGGRQRSVSQPEELGEEGKLGAAQF